MSILSSFSLQEILKKILLRMLKMSWKHFFLLGNFLFWNIFLHLPCTQGQSPSFRLVHFVTLHYLLFYFCAVFIKNCDTQHSDSIFIQRACSQFRGWGWSSTIFPLSQLQWVRWVLSTSPVAEHLVFPVLTWECVWAWHTTQECLKCPVVVEHHVTSGSDPRGTRNADSNGRPITESD